MAYTQSSGRDVVLYRLQLSQTYAGCLVGNRETNTPVLLELIPERRPFADDTPLLILDGGVKALPRWQWIAEFVSLQTVKVRNPDCNSHLCICWFTEDTNHNLDEQIQTILDSIDWEQYAEDYDAMP